MLKIRGMDIYYVRGDDDSFTIQPANSDSTVTYQALSQTEIDTCFA